MPNLNVAMGWGEYHYALSLGSKLEAHGHHVELSFASDWKKPGCTTDVDIVLRGGRPFEPSSDRLSILWVISHPSQVTKAERDLYDWVYVASNTLPKDWLQEGSTNVSTLLQATDETRFFPNEPEPDKSHDILFVGNRHKKKIRKAVDFALQVDIPISVYGGAWEALVPPENIGGKTIPNSDLGSYYRSAGMVLNDHWPDQAENGILSNRMFDVLATGRPLISDRPKGVPADIASYVYFYETPEQLRQCVDQASAETPHDAERRKQFAQTVLDEHSFTARAKEISEKISELSVKSESGGKEPSFCIVTCVKNEGPYLVEWIAHNRRIGVTDFLIFSNDCDDGTVAVLDRLDEMGIVRHLPNPCFMTDGMPLGTCLRYAPLHKEFGRSDYIIIIDVDEFITFAKPDQTLGGYVNDLGRPDIISMSELVFGFGGVEMFEDKPVLSQFHHASDLRPGKNRARRGVKSIMRNNGKIRAFTNHRPKLKPEYFESTVWTDGIGRPVASEFAQGKDRGFDCRGCYEQAIVNHFTLRSGESMLLKLQRGDAARQNRLNQQYFRKRNQNRQEVTHHLRAAEAVTSEIEKLLEDDVLAQAHKNSVELTKKKIKALKSDPEMSAHWADILSVVKTTNPKAELVDE